MVPAIFRFVCHTWSSSCESICEVASSITMIFVRRKIALAKATSCLSPALKEPSRLMGMARVRSCLSVVRLRREVR